MAESIEEAGARLRESGKATGVSVARSDAVPMLTAIAVPACPAEVLTDPEHWFECIEALEEAGRDADAEEQRELLKEAFPDFEFP